jgi:hypothetical protein
MLKLTILPAGGQAVDSNMKRMIQVVPEGIHDRSGIFMGSYDEVQKVIDIHAKLAKQAPVAVDSTPAPKPAPAETEPLQAAGTLNSEAKA